MKIWIARDTDSICIFLSEPVKCGTQDDFFYVDPKKKDFLEIKEPPEDLLRHINVGEMFTEDI